MAKHNNNNNNNDMVYRAPHRFGEGLSTEELIANSNSIKEYYIKNILRGGLPSIHFDTVFKVTFANVEYELDMLDLKHLDFFKMPIEGQQYQATDKSVQEYVSIGYHKALIPAKVNGEYRLLTAQHKLGSLILSAYFRHKWKLLDELNFVIEAIDSYEFSNENTFTKFYENIFGKPDVKTFRIPLY